MMAAPGARGVAHVLEPSILPGRSQDVAIPLRQSHERRRAARGDRQNVRSGVSGVLVLTIGGMGGSLLDDHVRVGSRPSERADARQTTSVVAARPGAGSGRNDEPGAFERNVRVERREMRERRNRLVAKRQDHFDQAGDARRALEVSDVRLHRAQIARSGFGAGLSDEDEEEDRAAEEERATEKEAAAKEDTPDRDRAAHEARPE